MASKTKKNPATIVKILQKFIAQNFDLFTYKGKEA
jgi:hypothetical protein